MKDKAIFTNSDIFFMKRCLELAVMGRGLTAPNPMVGSVIVHAGKIIGEGYHREYGEKHAEVAAIESVAEPELLKESRLYVNLEPCSHYGKTPPCADYIINKSIPEVHIGTIDSNPLVGGKGIHRMQEAGIRVMTGLLEEESRLLNCRFFTYHEHKRPYLILKWAQSKDGFLDVQRSAEDPVGPFWITGSFARQMVHQWRSEEQAIAVGSGTALMDDPNLNVRHWYGKNPLRILIDRHEKVDDQYKLFDKSQPTLVYTLNKTGKSENLEFVALKTPRDFISRMLEDLYRRSIQSLIIEGGSEILRAFIKGGLWDEARIFVGHQVFQKGVKAPEFPGKPSDTIRFGSDSLIWIKKKREKAKS